LEQDRNADNLGAGWYCTDCSYVTDEEPEQEMQEPYEYWFVSSWLADKLAERGEVVIREFSMPIWGRGATGQAILLDGVIGEIAEELEILDGQKYDSNKA
jgi:hypothetical protein